MQHDLSKPVVGVTMGLTMEDHDPQIYPDYRFEFLKQQYYEALEECGLVIIPMPNTPHIEHTDYYIELIDGLMLVGGEDLTPGLYGQGKSEKTGATHTRRDYFEREMIFKAVSRKMPILGICRGHQAINVVFGGSLYQDLDDREERTIDHRQTQERDFSNTHEIEIIPDSRLSALLGKKSTTVNSAHHQILRRIPEGLRVAAVAPDGVVEALEGADDNYILTVQWHPEVVPDSEVSAKIFEDFSGVSRAYKRRK
ncbi:MAG TPA: gamma-glutamyl-gamma-aminobutyrate hydrolase family protein [candidate division Zixibacteria bacterium]|nr:gamma-glutamyl-gamma-aminobutyrate hydrolase family protein [candidate division Zixibacteria bacterium]